MVTWARKANHVIGGKSSSWFTLYVVVGRCCWVSTRVTAGLAARGEEEGGGACGDCSVPQRRP